MGKGRKIKDLRTFGTDFKRKNEKEERKEKKTNKGK